MLVPSGAVSYLASSSRGVSVHFVVRVVVTALESASPDTADSSDSSRTPRSRILTPTPERREKAAAANESERHRTRVSPSQGGERRPVHTWHKEASWVTDGQLHCVWLGKSYNLG